MKMHTVVPSIYSFNKHVYVCICVWLCFMFLVCIILLPLYRWQRLRDRFHVTEVSKLMNGILWFKSRQQSPEFILLTSTFNSVCDFCISFWIISSSWQKPKASNHITVLIKNLVYTMNTWLLLPKFFYGNM